MNHHASLPTPSFLGKALRRTLNGLFFASHQASKSAGNKINNKSKVGNKFKKLINLKYKKINKQNSLKIGQHKTSCSMMWNENENANQRLDLFVSAQHSTGTTLPKNQPSSVKKYVICVFEELKTSVNNSGNLPQGKKYVFCFAFPLQSLPYIQFKFKLLLHR